MLDLIKIYKVGIKAREIADQQIGYVNKELVDICKHIGDVIGKQVLADLEQGKASCSFNYIGSVFTVDIPFKTIDVSVSEESNNIFKEHKEDTSEILKGVVKLVAVETINDEIPDCTWIEMDGLVINLEPCYNTWHISLGSINYSGKVKVVMA